jgi:hypothetical protein
MSTEATAMQITQEPQLSAVDLRGRAAAGGVQVAARSVVASALTIVGAITLAQLLVPRDFGPVALLPMLGVTTVGPTLSPRGMRVDVETGGAIQ